MLEPFLSSIVVIFLTLINGSAQQKLIRIRIDVVSPGVLGNFSGSSITLGGPAYDLSLATLNDAFSDSFNITHTYLYDERIKDCDTFMFEVQNILSRWYYAVRKDYGFPVIITPGCVESAQLNQLAAAWNVLLITTANTDPDLYDKSKSPTWVTTNLYPSSYYGEVFSRLMIYHNWSSIEMLYDQNSSGFYSAANRLTKALLKQYGLQSVSQVYSSLDPSFQFNFTSFLINFSTRNRVLLFLGKSTQLRILMTTAHALNMTNGEYVYICGLPFPWRGYGDYSWQYGDANDEAVREAYNSLILVTMIDLTLNSPADLPALLTSWKKRFAEVPFFLNTKLETDPPLAQLTSTTAAIEIFGQILNETLQENRPLSQETGSSLAGRMINRTFITTAGNITFDRNGERRPLLVTSSYFDPTSGTFKAYLQSDINEGIFRWRVVRPVLFHGQSTLPPSEPICGFTGSESSCRSAGFSTSTLLLIVILPVAVITFLVALSIKRAFCPALDDLWWRLSDIIVAHERNRMFSMASCAILEMKENDNLV